MSLAMTRAEREKFLADVHVGVISIQHEGHAPLTVPIWYLYEPGGEVVIVTGRDSRKGVLLAQTGVSVAELDTLTLRSTSNASSM